jgi:hypothetical protein
MKLFARRKSDVSQQSTASTIPTTHRRQSMSKRLLSKSAEFSLSKSGSNSNQQHDSSMRAGLVKYVKLRKFDVVLKVLLDDDDTALKALAGNKNNNDSQVQEPFLYTLLRHDPPVEVVVLVVNLMERNGQYSAADAMHVAVEAGCPKEVLDVFATVQRRRRSSAKTTTKQQKLTEEKYDAVPKLVGGDLGESFSSVGFDGNGSLVDVSMIWE